MRKLLSTFIAALLLVSGVAEAQQVILAPFNYTNITTDATTTIKSGSGILHNICLNGVTAAEVITIYDNTAASGTKIGTITVPTGQTIGCQRYDVAFKTGLTIVTATQTGDVTVSWL